MGRTLPTITQTLQTEEECWKAFRRALRREDQEAFDTLWRFAQHHAAPAAMAGRAVPLEAAVMAMLVGLTRKYVELERRMAEIEKAGARDVGGKTGGLAV